VNLYLCYLSFYLSILTSALCFTCHSKS